MPEADERNGMDAWQAEVNDRLDHWVPPEPDMVAKLRAELQAARDAHMEIEEVLSAVDTAKWALAAKIDRMNEHAKARDRRIKAQRAALRKNWEIVDAHMRSRTPKEFWKRVKMLRHLRDDDRARAEKAEADRDAALAHVSRLKEALEPIATAWDYAGTLFDRPVMDDMLCTVARSCIDAGDFKAACTAVALMEDAN